MKKVWKRLGIVAAMLALTGMLAGCGGKDNVGVVDMSRVQKEAPLVQQYKQKTEDKQKSIEKELQDAQQNMSAEDFQKKQQQAQQPHAQNGDDRHQLADGGGDLNDAAAAGRQDRQG